MLDKQSVNILVIEVAGLTKRYGEVLAVNDIGFQVSKGEIFGFLGPNGAGKTTTINMLTGLARLDAGTITIGGIDCTRNPKAAQHLIGIVPDESNLYPELTGFENLCFCAALYGMRKDERQKRARELLEAFGLTDAADRKFAGYSKGMKRKLTFAAGIIHRPPILFLDEPTTGIDVASARQVRQIIAGLHRQGTTVFLTAHYLEERLGFKVTYLPVDKYGLVDPEDVRRAIPEETIMITIMHANNEVGTIEPIAEIGEMARERGILFHTDAAQSCGKFRVDVNELKVDLLTIAGHKVYAPKGIGALFIRNGIPIDSFIHGAGQEKGRRAGTENVPYMVGLGKACELASQSLEEYGIKAKGLRDRLYKVIFDGLGNDMVRLNGHPERRLPNTLNISIRGIIGDALLSRIPEIAASTGAACHAGSTEPSSVLLEMGLSRELALEALRLTLGRWSTTEEIDTGAELIIEHVKRQTVPQSANSIDYSI